MDYKRAYHLLMMYFGELSEESKKEIDEELNKLSQ